MGSYSTLASCKESRRGGAAAPKASAIWCVEANVCRREGMPAGRCGLTSAAERKSGGARSVPVHAAARGGCAASCALGCDGGQKELSRLRCDVAVGFLSGGVGVSKVDGRDGDSAAYESHTLERSRALGERAATACLSCSARLVWMSTAPCAGEP